MKTKLRRNTICRRFAKRSWAVRLSVNCRSVNHIGFERDAAVVTFSPEPDEPPRRALRRFVEAVEQAAAKSQHSHAVLSLRSVELYPEQVIERLADLLHGRWTLSAMRARLIVNLELDVFNPATPRAIERILGKSAGGTVAGMSKMPDR